LTFDRVYHGTPAVCNHGSVIVYSSDVGGTSNLWKLDPQSGNPAQVANTSTGLMPACAAEGESIFFWGKEKGIHMFSRFHFLAANPFGSLIVSPSAPVLVVGTGNICSLPLP
jgi:hypothetical protein